MFTVWVKEFSIGSVCRLLDVICQAFVQPTPRFHTVVLSLTLRDMLHGFPQEGIDSGLGVLANVYIVEGVIVDVVVVAS